MRSKRKLHQPGCMVVHTLLNKLSTIVGNCDLLLEDTEKGSDCAHKLTVIREAAESAAKEITEHQRQVEAEQRSTEQKAS